MKHFFTNSEKINEFSDMTFGQMHTSTVGVLVVITIFVIAVIRAHKNSLKKV